MQKKGTDGICMCGSHCELWGVGCVCVCDGAGVAFLVVRDVVHTIGFVTENSCLLLPETRRMTTSDTEETSCSL